MEDKERKRDRRVVQDVDGDPAFYNDQIGKDQEPVKKIMDEKKGRQ